MKFFSLIDRIISALLKPAVVLLSLSVAILMVTGIVSRELIGTPLLGLEELILFAVIWLYMLGAALASRDRSHLSGDFVQAITSNPHTLRFFRLLASIISFGMAVVFSVWSYSLLDWGITHQQSTAVLRIPFYVVQSSMFVCAVLLVFYALRDVFNDARAWREERLT